MKGKKSLQSNEHLQIKLQHDNSGKTFYFNAFIIHQLLFCAMVSYIISSFALTTNFLLAFVLSQLLIIFLHINIQKTKLRRYILIGIVSFLLLLVIVFNRHFINGLYIIYEQVAHIFTMQTSRIIRPFEVTIDASEEVFSEQLFSVCFLIGIVFLSYFIVKVRSNWSLSLLVVSVIGFEVWTNIKPNLFIHVSFYFIILVIYILFYMADRHTVKELLTVAIVTFILLGGIYGAMYFIESPKTYEKQPIVKQIENKLLSKWKDFRYEKKHTHNFTNGDFTQLEPLDVNEEVALEVIMSDPISVYLRGFVGVTYTSERWRELDSGKYDEAFDMLYWLDQDAFHPLEQLYALNQVLNGEVETNKVSVQNVNGDSQYLYTPYELSMTPKQKRENYKELDQTFLSNGFFGERYYTFDTTENIVTQYPALANELYKSRKNEDVNNYITYESYYNDFVYDAYTDVPENISMMLENHIGKVQTEDLNEHVPYEWAIHKITSYLEENIAYDKEVEVFQMEEDFLMQFLEKERKGYAPHFATAATVMFRYFDIPARYVEGYIISPELIKDVDPYEKLLVNGTHAHAWTEIYIDEIGWIPIEVTPGYEDVMEKIDLSDYPSGASDSDVESMYEEPEDGFNDGKQEIEDESIIEEMNNEPKESLHWLIWLIVIVGFILIIALLLYIIYIVRRRIRLKKFIQSFEVDEVNVVVNRIFSYVLFLMTYDGIRFKGGSIISYLPKIKQIYGEQYCSLFEEAWKLHQRSLYRKEPLTEDAREVMLDFYKQSLKTVIQDKSMLVKIKMKYIDAAYDKL